jgi:hypothetical protein
MQIMRECLNNCKYSCCNPCAKLALSDASNNHLSMNTKKCWLASTNITEELLLMYSRHTF